MADYWCFPVEKRRKSNLLVVATGSCEPGRDVPSSVRSCPEPVFDPVEQIVPIVRHLIIIRATGAVIARVMP